MTKLTAEILELCRNSTPLPTSASNPSADDFVKIIVSCLPVPELSITENPFTADTINRVIDLLSPNTSEDVFGDLVGTQERYEVLKTFNEAHTLIKNGTTSEPDLLETFKLRKQEMFDLLCGTPAIVYMRGLYASTLVVEDLKSLPQIGMLHWKTAEGFPNGCRNII